MYELVSIPGTLLAILATCELLILLLSLEVINDAIASRQNAPFRPRVVICASISGLLLIITVIAIRTASIRGQFGEDSISVSEILLSDRGAASSHSWTPLDHVLEVMINAPAVLIIAVLTMVTVMLIEIRHDQAIWHQTHLSKAVLKEAIDNLPIGLCFYQHDGQIVLANYMIKALAYKLTGEYLWTPELLVKQIDMDKPYVTSGDRVYRFSIQDLNDEFTQLSAIDVTEQYILLSEIEEENKKLSEMNSHLREYSLMVDQIIKEEEQLDTRIRIHDDLGRILLSTKVYLSDKSGIITRDTLLKKWDQALELLRGESAKNWNHDSFALISDAAAQVGLRIEIDGEMPKDNRILHVIISGARECITNSAHAGATTLVIRIRSTSGSIEVTYQDNGTPPSYPVREGGGLSSLRQIVEREGVVMEIADGGSFYLKLTIPREVI